MIRTVKSSVRIDRNLIYPDAAGDKLAIYLTKQGAAGMTEAEGTFVNCEHFVEVLKKLPWCRQGDSVLVAVEKCTPEHIEVMKDHECKVFPGGIAVKMNKSLLHSFQEKFDEGQPVPLVFVWKPEGVEIWYRRHKTQEFPYDMWMDPAAAAYERERVFIPAASLGTDVGNALQDVASRTKECPAMVPKY